MPSVLRRHSEDLLRVAGHAQELPTRDATVRSLPPSPPAMSSCADRSFEVEGSLVSELVSTIFVGSSRAWGSPGSEFVVPKPAARLSRQGLLAREPQGPASPCRAQLQLAASSEVWAQQLQLAASSAAWAQLPLRSMAGLLLLVAAQESPQKQAQEAA